MVKPNLSIRGSSRDALSEGYQSAIGVLFEARAAVAEASPNMRDYYPDVETFKQAVAEHDARLDKVSSVIGELQELAEHVANSP